MIRQRLVTAGRSDLLGALDGVLVGFALDRAKVPGISQAEIDRLVALNVRGRPFGQMPLLRRGVSASPRAPTSGARWAS